MPTERRKQIRNVDVRLRISDEEKDLIRVLAYEAGHATIASYIRSLLRIKILAAGFELPLSRED